MGRGRLQRPSHEQTLWHGLTNTVRRVPFAWIAAAALFSGCTTHSGYVPPQQGPTARLRVSDLQASPFQASIYTFAQPNSCRGRLWFQGPFKRMNPKLPETRAENTAIAAGKPFRLSINKVLGGSGTSGVTYCVAVFEFTPEKDRDYLASFSPHSDGCRVALSSSISMRDSREELIRTFKYRTGWNESDTWCEEQ